VASIAAARGFRAARFGSFDPLLADERESGAAPLCSSAQSTGRVGRRLRTGARCTVAQGA
jgi:hypothetical protein